MLLTALSNPNRLFIIDIRHKSDIIIKFGYPSGWISKIAFAEGKLPR